MDASSAILVFIFVVVALFVYFFPSYIAFKRKHKNKLAILAANFFFGWVLIGWVVAFIWSLTGNVEEKG